MIDMTLAKRRLDRATEARRLGHRKRVGRGVRPDRHGCAPAPRVAAGGRTGAPHRRSHETTAARRVVGVRLAVATDRCYGRRVPRPPRRPDRRADRFDPRRVGRGSSRQGDRRAIEAADRAVPVHSSARAPWPCASVDLAEQRNAEGYVAEVVNNGRDLVLVEHHCPICVAATTCQRVVQVGAGSVPSRAGRRCQRRTRAAPVRRRPAMRLPHHGRLTQRPVRRFR